MPLKENFLKIYVSLPIGARKEIVLTLDPEGPITWEVAFMEVESETPLSLKILEKLSLLGII